MSEGRSDSLYSDALLYERIAHALGSDEDELAFYLDLLRAPREPGTPAQAKVLELGCGSGRLALPLAAAGCAVTGLDTSTGMLVLANEKAAAPLNGAVQWSLQDMRHFKLKQRFDWVLLPLNGIGHLHTLADMQACLGAVLRHLAVGGHVVIDIFNPSLPKLALAQGASRVFPLLDASNNAADPELLVNETSFYDAATQTSALCWQVRAGVAEVRELHFKLRIWFPQELDAILQLSGLRIVHKFGNYQAQPFVSLSPRQILVCAAVA